jgi:methanogen homoisocitrate dehydrogenase
MSGKLSSKRVAVVRGDGIGPEVIEAALRVMEECDAGPKLLSVDVGLSRWKRTGNAMDDADMETLKECDCILFGAITTPPDPAYRSVLLRIRKGLDLYANIRPFKSFTTGVNSSNLDCIIVRENTEGLYSGIEEIGDNRSTTLRVITKDGSRRIACRACEIALERRKLTIVHKSNVLKSDHLFLRTCRDVAAKMLVPCDEMLVDSAAYTLVKNPSSFDVIVTTNLFGDILSDEAAGIVGSLGLCASANIGEGHALFEPIHGSAPDIAGKGVANPIGAIRSAAMMIRWLGDTETADRIEAAVDLSLHGCALTPDLGGTAGTREMTDAVISRL